MIGSRLQPVEMPLRWFSHCDGCSTGVLTVYGDQGGGVATVQACQASTVATVATVDIRQNRTTDPSLARRLN